MSEDFRAKPTPRWFAWLPVVLAVPPAIAAVIFIVDYFRPKAVYGVLFSLLATAVLFAFMLLLRWLLRKLDRHVSALVLLAFSAGIVVGIVFAGQVMPPRQPSQTSSTITHPPPPPPVTITYPRNNAVVESQIRAGGIVRVTDAKVWTIVHPVSTAGYWVQPLVTVNPDGTWNGTVCFGSSDTFELVAVANPLEALRPGQVLDDWPEAEAKSQAVQVIR